MHVSRGTRRPVAPHLVAALLAVASAANAAPPATVEEPLDLESMYARRFRFDPDGQPLVSVGLMDAQPEVFIRADAALSARGTDARKVERTVAIPAARRLRVSVTSARPAVIRPWAVVETLERDERLRREAALQDWARRLAPLEVRIFEVGGIYGVEGTVVDNRATLITAAPPQGARWEDFQASLYAQHAVRARLHEELVDLPGGRVTLALEDGKPLVSFQDLVELRTADGSPMTVEKVEHSAGYKNHGFEDRAYGARVVVAVDRSGRLAVANVVPVDGLLKGIVPSEIFPSSPAEALKAQAVTARGEVFAKVGLRHLTDPYALCDEQHCQVYSGVSAERPGTSAAVDATRGEMAFLGGRLVDSVYSAMCGGRSEDNEVVWEVPPASALRGRVDFDGAAELLAASAPRPTVAGPVHDHDHQDGTPRAAHPGHVAARDMSNEVALRAFLDNPPPAWCQRATLGRKDRFRWDRRFTRAEATERARDLGVGEVTAITVESRGPSGRVRTLRVEGTTGTAHVHRELPVRRLFNNLPSGMFVVDVERAPDGTPVAFTFKGGGFGHGVGMCQTGAVGMAEAGRDYREILRHYYNGAEVRRVY